MRCEARLDCVGGADSACRTTPTGGPATEAPPTPLATSAIAAPATAQALPKRIATRLIEEVQVLRVDRHRHLVAELELDVRRERRDEVRPRADHRLFGIRREDFLLLGLLGLDRARVDPE